LYGIFHIFHKQQFNYTKDRVSDCPVLLTALWTSCMYVDTAVRAYKRVLEAVKCLPIVYSWYCDFSVFFFIFHKNFIIFIKNSLKLTLQKLRVFFIYLFYLSTCQNPPWSILLATELEQYIGHCFCSVGHSSCCTVILLQRNQHFILQVHKTVVASK